MRNLILLIIALFCRFIQFVYDNICNKYKNNSLEISKENYGNELTISFIYDILLIFIVLFLKKIINKILVF